MVLKLILRQAASICHINLKTELLWRHRILMAKAAKKKDTLSGIIEVDTALVIDTHFKPHIASHSVLCSDGA